MFRLYGFFTQNSLKTLYVLEEVVGDFEFQFIDLSKGEQKTEEFSKMTPVGKVPVLEHDGEYLFESGAICRYIANLNDSPLYPGDSLPRARVDQWMDFFSCHLGHWLNKLYFEAVIKPNFNLGGPDEEGIAEATKFAQLQLGMLNTHLEGSDWLANDALSIADLFAFAYIEQHQTVEMSLDEYANVKAWKERIESRPSIANAKARLPNR
jgi:glutathione S-transferase